MASNNGVLNSDPRIEEQEREYKLNVHAISAVRAIAEAAIQTIREQNQTATPLPPRFGGKEL